MKEAKLLLRTGNTVYDCADPQAPKLVGRWMKGAWYSLRHGKTSMEWDLVDPMLAAELDVVKFGQFAAPSGRPCPA